MAKQRGWGIFKRCDVRGCRLCGYTGFRKSEMNWPDKAVTIEALVTHDQNGPNYKCEKKLSTSLFKISSMPQEQNRNNMRSAKKKKKDGWPSTKTQKKNDTHTHIYIDIRSAYVFIFSLSVWTHFIL